MHFSSIHSGVDILAETDDFFPLYSTGDDANLCQVQFRGRRSVHGPEFDVCQHRKSSYNGRGCWHKTLHQGEHQLLSSHLQLSTLMLFISDSDLQLVAFVSVQAVYKRKLLSLGQTKLHHWENPEFSRGLILITVAVSRSSEKQPICRDTYTTTGPRGDMPFHKTFCQQISLWFLLLAKLCKLLVAAQVPRGGCKEGEASGFQHASNYWTTHLKSAFSTMQLQFR